MKLVYVAGPGEGPEPKRLGHFGLEVRPGEPWGPVDATFAKQLQEAFPNHIREFQEPDEPADLGEESAEPAEDVAENPVTQSKRGSQKKGASSINGGE